MAPDNITEWTPSARLEWSHFEADAHSGAYQDALASIRYDCNWVVESHKSGESLFFTIQNIRLITSLVRNLSWVRRGVADDALLAHMQGCFDLAEHLRPDMEEILAARFSQKRYPVRGSNEEERRQCSLQDSRTALGHLDDIHQMLSSEIARYESDTEYGRNAKVQSKYDRMFEEMRRARSA
ncbi:MAG: hypothetical protein J4G04_08610 [Nitrosopumilaceae archaeon]|nr:hypothetical protein [Nitrosopumilaceae archaeon]